VDSADKTFAVYDYDRKTRNMTPPSINRKPKETLAL
jgi:hypothetical protein